VADYKFTEYFDKEVLRKRPYLKKEWCIWVLENPMRSEPQEGNPYRFLGEIEELEGRILRVNHVGGQAYGSQCFSRQRVQAMKLNYYPDTDGRLSPRAVRPPSGKRGQSQTEVLGRKFAD